MDLNQVPIQTVKDELTPTGWAQIEQLCGFLFADRQTRISDVAWRHHIPEFARFAPSIVTRSEGEVFGLSRPRFCYRLYFKDAEGFINSRRLGVFYKQLAATAPWSERFVDLSENERHPRIVGEIQRRDPNSWSPIVADCLIKPPSRFCESDYKLITTNLDRDYGESIETHAPFQAANYWASPFIKHVDFGGGVCAQACCFMTTAMLRRFARGVHGLCEITALAASPQLRELLVGGLDEFEMVQFLEHAGLGARVQFADHPNDPLDAPGAAVIQKSDFFQEALHCYVASGFPVILTLDQSKLAGRQIFGESIYARNGYKVKRAPNEETPHAITVVGCSRWDADQVFLPPSAQKDRYLFHDPAAMPFMDAVLADIMKVGQTNAAGDAIYPALIPVTPAAVKVPLLTWSVAWNAPDKRGLLEVSRLHPSPKIPVGRRDFSLIQLEQLPSHFRVLIHFDQDSRGQARTLLAKIVDKGLANGWTKKHWVWVESGRRTAKIWDAESTVLDHRSCRATLCLDDYGRFTDTSSFESQPSAIPVREETGAVVPMPQRDSNQLAGLVPSAISSFTILGSDKAVAAWPPSIEHVEFYACMPNDLDRFGFGTSTQNATAELARALRIPGTAQKFAKELQECYAPRRMAAFATFMPELMSPRPEICQRATEALQFLIKVADFLEGDDLFTLELVGGSRLFGVWWAEATDGAPYFAINKLGSEQAVEILLERLAPVAEAAGVARRKIQLAVELEPGPLYVIRDRATVKRFCDAIGRPETPSSVKKLVGFNLDIAHWAFLSDISLEWLRLPANEDVRNRIVHAHISDHDKGHFADNIIGNIHRTGFEDWMAFLGELLSESKQRSSLLPRYSGIISCEIEASKGRGFVELSAKRLSDLVEKGWLNV